MSARYGLLLAPVEVFAQAPAFTDVPDNVRPDEVLRLEWAGVDDPDWKGRVRVLDPDGVELKKGDLRGGAGPHHELFGPLGTGTPFYVVTIVADEAETSKENSMRIVPSTPHFLATPDCAAVGFSFEVRWIAPPSWSGRVSLDNGVASEVVSGPGGFVERLTPTTPGAPAKVFIAQEGSDVRYDEQNVSVSVISGSGLPSIQTIRIGSAERRNGRAGDLVYIGWRWGSGQRARIRLRDPHGTFVRMLPTHPNIANGETTGTLFEDWFNLPSGGVTSVLVEIETLEGCPQMISEYATLTIHPYVLSVAPALPGPEDPISVTVALPPGWSGRFSLRRWDDPLGPAPSLVDVPLIGASQPLSGPGTFTLTHPPLGIGHDHAVIVAVAEAGSADYPFPETLVPVAPHFVEIPEQAESTAPFSVVWTAPPRATPFAPRTRTWITGVNTVPESTCGTENPNYPECRTLDSVYDDLTAPAHFSRSFVGVERGDANILLNSIGLAPVDAERKVRIGHYPIIVSAPANARAGEEIVIIWRPDPESPLQHCLQIRDDQGNFRFASDPWNPRPTAERIETFTVPDDVAELAVYVSEAVVIGLPINPCGEETDRWDERTITVGPYLSRVPDRVLRGARFDVDWRAPPGFRGFVRLVAEDGSVINGLLRTFSAVSSATDTLEAPGFSDRARIQIVDFDSPGRSFPDHEITLVDATVTRIMLNQSVQRVRDNGQPAVKLAQGRDTGLVVDFDRQDGVGSAEGIIRVSAPLGDIRHEETFDLIDGLSRVITVLPGEAFAPPATGSFRVEVRLHDDTATVVEPFWPSAPYHALIVPIVLEGVPPGVDDKSVSIDDMLDFLRFLYPTIPSADIDLIPLVFVSMPWTTDFTDPDVMDSLTDLLADLLGPWRLEYPHRLVAPDVPLTVVGGAPAHSIACGPEPPPPLTSVTGCAKRGIGVSFVSMAVFDGDAAYGSRGATAAQEIAHNKDLIGSGPSNGGPGMAPFSRPNDLAHENCNHRLGFEPPGVGPSPQFEHAEAFDIVSGDLVDRQVSYMGYTSDCDDVTKRDVWTTIHTQQILYSQLVRCLNGCSYAEGDYLVLRARLGRKGTGRITNSYLRAGFLDATEFSGGKWAVVLRNASGSKIDSFSFDIDFHIHIAEQANQQANELPIQLVVPVRDRASVHRVELVHGGRVLDVATRSKAPPSVEIIAPSHGTKLEGKAIVQWKGSDADGDELRYSVLYSHDGRTWTPLAADLEGEQLEVDFNRLPGGVRSLLRVDVSDGILANSVSSGPHSVPDKAPARAIHHPTPGMQFVEGAKVRLFGTALDLEDGKLASKRITWASDIDGPLGIGSKFATSSLAIGSHVITMRAVDASGNESSAKTSVFILRDSDRDGMPDEWEKANGLRPDRKDASEDADGDGLSNLQELLIGSNPRAKDGGDGGYRSRQRGRFKKAE